MDMIWHTDESIQFDMGEAGGKRVPNGLSNFSTWAEVHLRIDDLAKAEPMFERTNGITVEAWLAVIIIENALCHNRITFLQHFTTYDKA